MLFHFVGFLRRCGRAAPIAVLAALCGWVQSAPADAAAMLAGPPPGEARIWLYRDYEPYVSLATPYVRLNGQIIGISEPGGTFYRDVAPGEYKVTVNSQGRDVNQFARVAVVAGQQIYIKVEALRYWDCGGGARGGGWCRTTFYTRLQLPQIAATAVAHSPFYGGS